MSNKTLGIIGGGQLGRMLCEAAKKLSVKTIVLDPTPNSPASQVADFQIVGDFKNSAKIKLLSKKVDFLTFEIESANTKVLKELEEHKVKVQPAAKTLETIQDKLFQKEFLLSNNIPVAEFQAVNTKTDIIKVAEYLGYPLVLKTRFYGYDGRGNALIKNQSDIEKAIQKLGVSKLYVEKFIPFKKELAIQIVRDGNGKTKAFPLVETIQQNDICHIVKFPASVPKETGKIASKLASRAVAHLFGTGVFAVEMFETKDNKVLINEIAPRVHNSGHWTIEGCQTSQFEEHVRAVCALPLKSTKPKVKAAVMINILGKRNGKAKPVGVDRAENLDGIYTHIYGKFETRKERKMGHLTAVGKALEETLTRAKRARSYITI